MGTTPVCSFIMEPNLVTSGWVWNDTNIFSVCLEEGVKSEHSESVSEVESEKEEEAEEEEVEDVLSVRSSLLLELGEGQKDMPPPFMEALWSFGCDLTRGNNVSCMAWNKLNPVSK